MGLIGMDQVRLQGKTNWSLTQLIMDESVIKSIFKQKKASLCNFKVEQNISTLFIALKLALQLVHWFYFTFHLFV